MKTDTFESLDFCFDVVDDLDSHKLRYISVILAVTKKVNRTCVLHSTFSLDEIKNDIPKLILFALNNIQVGHVKSQYNFVNKNTEHIRKQNIEYIYIILDNTNVELNFYIKDNESLQFAGYVLQKIPEMMENISQQSDDNGTEHV